jgi:hypothetical protein
MLAGIVMIGCLVFAVVTSVRIAAWSQAMRTAQIYGDRRPARFGWVRSILLISGFMLFQIVVMAFAAFVGKFYVDMLLV